MNKIYLDNNSTTQLDPEILDAMLPLFTEKYGNPSSKTHSFGWEAEAYVENSRKKISDLINCESSEIIFTSGATESNNLAILNLDYFSNKNIHMITMDSEHRAILDIFKFLEKKGTEVTYIKPAKNGLVNINDIEKAIKNKTKLISIMHVNNEIGVIQPIEKIGELCKENNVIFHVDAAQSLGKINIDMKKLNITLMSFSSHKIYGPKGVGCLYVQKKFKNLKSIFYGGNQEKGLRPGTLPVPLIVGFGKACEIAKNIMNKEAKGILYLRTFFLEKIKLEIPDVIINGDINNRIPGNINLSFPSLQGQSIINSLQNIAVSSGSACTSSSPKPSHVLLSIGLNKRLSNSSIRICIGRFNTIDEIKIASQAIVNAVKLKSRNNDKEK